MVQLSNDWCAFYDKKQFKKFKQILQINFLIFVLCLISVKITQPTFSSFWYEWFNMEYEMSFLVMNLKLVAISFMFFVADLVDLRKYETAFYYFVIARYNHKYDFFNKIERKCSVSLLLVYICQMALLMQFFQTERLSQNIWLAIITELVSQLSLLLFLYAISVSNKMISSICINLLNKYLPIKMPFATAFANSEQLYSIFVYMFVFICLIFILMNRRWLYDYSQKLIKAFQK